MKKRALALGSLVSGGLLAAIVWETSGSDPHGIPTDHGGVVVRSGRAAELSSVRRACKPDLLESFIAAQRHRARTDSSGRDLHLLGEALLERVLMGSLEKGMRVGEPIYSNLPKRIARWIDEGIEALHRARGMGVETSESYRIESALLSNKITGLVSALQLNGAVTDGLHKALELDDKNPNAHVAAGCRHLFAPHLLGHDPKKALRHFVFAAKGLPEDERPRTFAAMACWLMDRRDDARSWLEAAARANPANPYVEAVLRRVKRGSEDPFGQDLGPKDGKARGR